VVIALLVACGGPATVELSSVPEMSATRLLTRLSLDLRGTRPALSELERVEADPAVLDTLIDEMLHDDAFGDRVMDLFEPYYLTRADTFDVSAEAFDLDAPAFASSIGQEPLRILREVAVSDMPWTEIVTGDWTMANETTGAMWPLDYEDGQAGWQRSRYTDGRPSAGVLSTNGLWWRYTSTDSNANRKRANVASRLLLCNDYLVRPIEFERDVDLLDEEAVLEAVKNDPGCVGCHVSLDGMSAAFFGFWAYDEASYLEITSYHPDRELLYDDYLETAPAFYGTPIDGLEDLGHAIAADARFPECAVEQVWTALLGRAPGLDDSDSLTAHREAFLDGGLGLRSLLTSVVADPLYRAAQVDDVGASPSKMVGAGQLASQVEALTGYHWTYADYDMMRSDLIGVRTLAGGVDGEAVTRNATAPNTTLVLVQERLAEVAGSHVVATDADRWAAGETPRLFSEVDPSAALDSSEAAVAQQVVLLHTRVLSSPPADDALAAELALLEDLYALAGDSQDAWTGLLSALMRDPDFLIY